MARRLPREQILSGVEVLRADRRLDDVEPLERGATRAPRVGPDGWGGRGVGAVYRVLQSAARRGGGYRGVFDSGLSVAMTNVLSLTAGLNYRYNSDPGPGLKESDTLFVTGIPVKLA